MLAVVATEAGGPRTLRPREVPDPVAGEGQALVRVEAAGVNYADVVLRRGGLRTPLPIVPGLEGAGVVEAVGAGVTEVAPGDRVAWAPTGHGAAMGAYAEKAVLPASQLLPRPDGLAAVDAAAITLQGLTVHYLATGRHPVGPGVVVLVHAAAGGTGRLAVEWFTHLGATVIGTVSDAAKEKIARDAGCAHVIRYTETDFADEARRLTGGEGVDYVVDGVGSTFARDLAAVRDRGHICLFGQAGGRPGPFDPMALLPRAITVSGGSMDRFLRTRAETLATIADVWAGVGEGWLTARPAHVLPLAEAARAHELLEGRAAAGKIVLVP